MNNNELIAEFMGLKYHNAFKEWILGGKMRGPDLLFDYSWDWLMPVVDKIKVIYVTHKTFHDQEFQKVLDSKITVSIEKLHERIVHFIKWYNENRKTV